MRLEKLTPEQEAMLPVFRDKWLAIGLSCEPLDFDNAKAAASDAYRAAGLEPPKTFLRFQSPLSGAIGATILKGGASVRASVRDSVRDSVADSVWDSVGASVWASVWDSVGDSVWASVWDSVGDSVGDSVWDSVRDSVRDSVWASVYGNHDAHWLGFYETLSSFGITECEKLRPLMRLAESCGWWIPYQNVCILQDRPLHIKWDDRNRLHCEDGPAILYRDGFGVSLWHGTRIPNEWVQGKHPSAAEALRWENLEQRRAACEIVGWANILNRLDCKTIDTDPNPEIGTLVSVEIPDVGREQFLRVKCGTGREFALAVPPEIKTAREGNAWTYGLAANESFPEIRT